jgi:16S rRNA U1498 N3-methylase RsmE
MRRRILLDPPAERSLSEWIRPAADRDGRSVLVGPGGRIHRRRAQAFIAGGAVPVRLGPHVPALETAAEAAMAVLGAAS